MSYVFMRVLESAPSRYDRGINLITLGKISKAYDQLATLIKDKWTVIDIGCGTGAMAIRAAQQGAHVVGIDINPQMLEIASKNVQSTGLSDSVVLREQGIAELSNESSAQFDAAICSLVFSELSDNERIYTMNQLHRIIKPGGMLIIIDETRPAGLLKVILYWLIRIPMMVLTYIVTQTTSGAVDNISEMAVNSGFIIKEIQCTWLGDLTELVCINSKSQDNW